MVNLRVARAQDNTEVPLHYEAMGLDGRVRALGWAAAVVCSAGGVSIMVLTAGTGFDVLGALAAAVGAVLVAGLIRCRRFETTVTAKRISAAAGPLGERVPRELVEGAAVATAGSWRRLYADSEVSLRLTMGQTVTIPSREPAGLLASLGFPATPHP